jgi:hypothetical protein
MERALGWVVIGSIIVSLACGGSDLLIENRADAGAPAAGAPGAGSGGSVVEGGEGNGGTTGGTPGTQDAGESDHCGKQLVKLETTKVIPDVLIAFDRSASMNKAFGSGTRYTVERDLLQKLTAQYQDRVRFGFEQFPKNTSVSACDPNGPGCCADPVSISPALMNGAALAAALDAAGSGSALQTPTAPALRECRTFYQSLQDGVKERYVLLSTDGQPNCTFTSSGNGTVAANDAIAEIKELYKEGVKTIVLGVSEDAFGNALEGMAQAGGAPRPGGNPSYYPASDPAQLEQQLETIIGAIASNPCHIDLVAEPPSRDLVAVFADGVEVPHDAPGGSGWSWSPDGTLRIIVGGSWCSQIESGTVAALEVQFGCKPITIN